MVGVCRDYIFGGGAERELRVVLVGETLYQVDLFEGELYRVPVLRVARHVRGPELCGHSALFQPRQVGVAPRTCCPRGYRPQILVEIKILNSIV